MSDLLETTRNYLICMRGAVPWRWFEDHQLDALWVQVTLEEERLGLKTTLSEEEKAAYRTEDSKDPGSLWEFERHEDWDRYLREQHGKVKNPTTGLYEKESA